jgi:predicted HTH transcriptional regulator
MPFNPRFSITPKINKTLVEIERVRGFLDAVKLKGTSNNCPDVIASKAKQSRVFAKNYGRLPRRYAPRNDIEAIIRGPHLNVRQERIVRFLLLNERVDNEQCQVICKSIKRTATRDLTGLVEKSILQKHGEKKGTYYILAPEIENKIRDIKGHA